MTSQPAQLQALITEIEALLDKASPRLPWKMTGEATEQRRVMEQTLNYLKTFQDAGALSPDWHWESGAGAIAPTSPSSEAIEATEASSQQMLQALLQEMQYLRAQMVQPLTNEVMALQQQRETLKNEVRQLELERLRRAEDPSTDFANPAWINEVVGQLRSSLLEQLTPQLRALQSQIDATPALYGTAQDPLEVSADLPQLSPQQRLEQLRQIQAQTDYMLLKLDANLRAVFESLDQSIQSYSDTLNQGLDAMHGLGQQGEFIFRTFINHLAQQLQQESGYLTGSEEGRGRLQGRSPEDVNLDLAADDRDWSDELPSDALLNLDDVDLDELDSEVEVDEEVTLFQLDEEFGDVDLADIDDEDDLEDLDLPDFEVDEEQTVMQTEPIAWETITGFASDDSAADAAVETNQGTDMGIPYTEEIDSLYASLFGEVGPTREEAEAIAATPPSAETADDISDPLDETLFTVDSEPALPEPERATPGPNPLTESPIDTSLETLLSSPDADAETFSEVEEKAFLEEFLGTEITEELAPVSPQPAEPDVITSLTELLPSAEPHTYQQFADPFAAFDESGDNFIPAPPDEDLLETEASEVGTVLDLTLDEETFGQLTSDLSQLEGLSTEEMQRSSVLDFGAIAPLDNDAPETASDLVEETTAPEFSEPLPWDWPEAAPGSPDLPWDLIPEGETAELLSDEPPAEPMSATASDRPSASEAAPEIAESLPLDEVADADDRPDVTVDADMAELVLDEAIDSEDILAAEEALATPQGTTDELDLLLEETMGEIGEELENLPAEIEAVETADAEADAEFDALFADTDAAALEAEDSGDLIAPPFDLDETKESADAVEDSLDEEIDPDFAVADLFSEAAAPSEPVLTEEDNEDLWATSDREIVPIDESLEDLSIDLETAEPEELGDRPEPTGPSTAFDNRLSADAVAHPAEVIDLTPPDSAALEEVEQFFEDPETPPSTDDAWLANVDENFSLEDVFEPEPEDRAEPPAEPSASNTPEDDFLGNIFGPESGSPTAAEPADSGFSLEDIFESDPTAAETTHENAESEVQEDDFLENISGSEAASPTDPAESTDSGFSLDDVFESEPDVDRGDKVEEAGFFLDAVEDDFLGGAPTDSAPAEPEFSLEDAFEPEPNADAAGMAAAASLSDAESDLPLEETFGAATEPMIGSGPAEELNLVDSQESDFTLEDAFSMEDSDPVLSPGEPERNVTLNDAFGPETSELPEATAPDINFLELPDSNFTLDDAFSDTEAAASQSEPEAVDLPTDLSLSFDDTSKDEDYSLNLEGITLDLDIPDFSEEALLLQHQADEVDRTIADRDEALTLDTDLFPNPESRTETGIDWPDAEPTPPGETDTIGGWASMVDEVIADTEPGNEVMAEGGAVTPDALVDDLNFGELPTDIPPIAADASLEDWATTFGANADAEDSDSLSLENLDIDLSLDLETTDAPDAANSASTAEFATEGDLLAGLDEPTISASPDEERDRWEDFSAGFDEPTLPISGSIAEGFAVTSDADSLEQLQETLELAIPDREEADLNSADPFRIEPTVPPADLPPSALEISGSPAEGFNPTTPPESNLVEEILAALPTPIVPSVANADLAENLATKMGYPEPLSASAENPEEAPEDWMIPDFDLEGSVSTGFHLVTDQSIATRAVERAIAELTDAVEDDWMQEQATSPADADLVRQYGQRTHDHSDERLIAAATLPFASSSAELPDIPDYPLTESAGPGATPSPATATIDELFVSEASAVPDSTEASLPLQGSPATGFEVAVLDDAALEAIVRRLETLADLPAPNGTDHDQPDLGLLGATSDQIQPDDRPIDETLAALELPSLPLDGSYEEGFSLSEAAPDLEGLDLSAADDVSQPDTEAPWLSTEGEPATAPDEDAGPLSDDEFADFFPPRASGDETDELESLLSAATTEDEAAALLSEPDELVDEPLSEEVEIDEAIAELTGTSPVLETAEIDDFPETANFAELFPPEDETGDRPEMPGEDLTEAEDALSAPTLEDEAAFATDDDIRVEADAAEAEIDPSESLLETSSAAETAAEPPLDTSAEATDWDPMEADFPSGNLDFELLDEPEDDSIIVENIDLAMEEIPTAEIENDEAFRSAFDEDFSFAVGRDTVADTNPLAFDINDLGDLTDIGATSLLDLEAASVVADEEVADVEAITTPETAPAEAPPAPDPTEPPADADEAGFFASAGVLAAIPSDEEPGDDEPDLDFEPEGPQEEWFLGIDLGTSGLSAVLMEHHSGTAHPLCWVPQSPQSNLQTTFRMPAVASLHPHSETESTAWELEAIGLDALPQAPEDVQALLINQLRPLLRVGIPHQTTLGTWEPTLQWADNQAISLQQVLNSVSALLALITSPETAALHLEAVSLEADVLDEALENLQGVVIGMPNNWSDTYCLNIREAVLTAGLVESPGQIFFVEEAIAAVLSGLPDPSEPPPDSRQMQTLYQCNWQGGTVVISGGAVCTEVGIADLPQPLDALTRDDFKLRNLAYGGDALDLDIICQLLVPAERRQQINPGDRRQSRDGWSWQATLPEVANAQWESLQLESMDLPQLAEPDISARTRLRQHLEASKLGQSLLEAARYLKLILQNQNQYQLELADQSWRVLRRDLESRVLVPYIQRLNQQVNALLSQTGLSSQGINQVICTGGNASFNTIAKWLRQKFPNATIIQDTYPSNRPQTCSRVAYGLVNLCRYPQMLDVPRHQYSDYFLLHEIIRSVPETPLPLNGILHLLEERGINTEVCRSRIEAILEGHLPPGLIPDSATRDHLSRATLTSETYQALTAGPLFTKQTRQIYMMNSRQREIIGNHLAAIMLNKQQALTEPLIAQLVTL